MTRRIGPEEAFDGLRGPIYQLICENPGITLTGIMTRLRKHIGVVGYNMSVLERFGLIRAHRAGPYRRLYATAAGEPQSTARDAVLLTPGIQAALAAVRKEPGLTLSQIAGRLGTSRQNVTHHVRNAAKHELLRLQRQGRSIHITALPEPELEAWG